MPNKKQPEKKRSETQELIEAIDSLRVQLKKNEPKTGWRHFFSKLGNGILTGVGVVIGSTIIAGILLIGIQRIVTSEAFQERISEAIGTIVAQSISEAVAN